MPHFSTNNLPFGVASFQHSQPQCATRFNNTVIFLEIPATAARSNRRGRREHIFRLVILNNWSVKQPVTPKVGNGPSRPAQWQSLRNHHLPLIVTLEVLAEPRISLLRHLQGIVDFNYAISMKVELEHGASTTLLSGSRTQYLFWSGRQMGAHLASTGVTHGLEICTETASGSTEGSYGCLLEITQGERVPLALLYGSPRHFWQDGDASSGVGFGSALVT
ncbi:hypothetical protein Aspvir_004774 [Aspergillus viridinutans]|uniref:Fumarylacetoacetase n=1 Tax=Aspergillus viridinutans TaxID=75553 RepID=A0A9P3F3N4_ASPVI|nr:uncharacterized protein Aspvir_004774 [Aspergillus viridinutans]GIK00745.1 hypothetical protein Aspvir_004774 [Aspergillus viridinutans]